MKPVRVETTIRRPPEAVFDHLNVLANHEAFTDHYMTAWQLSGPPEGVGAEVHVKIKPGGQGVRVLVEEVERPRRIAERSQTDDGRRRSRGTWRMEAAGADATRVSFELAPEVAPAIDRPFAPLLRWFLRRQNTVAVRRLKEILER